MEKNNNPEKPGTYRIPVLEEELTVGKRRVETGSVKASIEVHDVEQVVEQPLTREKVEVQRVPIDRFIDRPAETRTEGDVTIVPVMEEVLVVEKRLRLKEELHIKRSTETVTHTHREVLRKEEAVVERNQGSNEAIQDDDPATPGSHSRKGG